LTKPDGCKLSERNFLQGMPILSLLFFPFFLLLLPCCHNEREREGTPRNYIDYSMVLARRDLVFGLFPNFLNASETPTGRHIRAKFCIDPSSDSMEIVAGERKEAKQE